jgi:EAL domain-containing protein (putative c-di-GMP-specific phosphodiesterase class I)
LSQKLQQQSAERAGPWTSDAGHLASIAKGENQAVVAAPEGDRRGNLPGNDGADLSRAAIDVAEALHAGWLELWYQPKIVSQTLELRGAEALLRMRHPQWGIVQPASFMPDVHDPRFRTLSQFVIDRAVADWRFFSSQHRQLDLSINLPISFLQNPALLEYLWRQLPEDPDFGGLIVEIDGSAVTRELSLARTFAKQAKLQKIAISIDRLGDQWAALADLRDFPFVEIKVEKEVVSGCAQDRSKRRLCQHIVDVANQFGARTVAVGVETHDDFLTARDLGFDLIQGFLFAKPMGVHTFLRTMVREGVNAL